MTVDALIDAYNPHAARERLQSILASMRRAAREDARQGECGLVCVAFVLSVLGRPTSIPELRALANPTNEPRSAGYSAAELCRVAESVSAKASGLRFAMGGLDVLFCPLIVHLYTPAGIGHFIALLASKRHGLVSFEPAGARLEVLNARRAATYSGVAIRLTLSTRAKPFLEPRCVSDGRWLAG